MAQDFVKFPMGGGLDRSKASHLSAMEDFYELLNFRPSRDEEGVIEQTPYFTLNKQFDQGTYWGIGAGASGPEGATSRVRGSYDYAPTKRLVLTDFCAWSGTIGALTQCQIFQQSVSVGTGSSLQTGCLMKIGVAATAAITLGQFVEVEIDGATTFKWRINGGAWTSLVTILAGGNTLGSTTITVYFLATSGYTIGWWWKWQRVDQFFEVSSTISNGNYTYQLSYCPHNNDIYFTSPNNGQIFRFEIENASGGGGHMISAGYRPFSGRYVTDFANHLVVAGHSYDATNLGTAATALRVQTAVGWSDRDNFDNFLASDTNEADIKYFSHAFAEIYTNVNKVLGLFVLQNQLYVLLIDSIWRTAYLGLPTVFNFEHFADFNPIGLDGSSFNAATAHYVKAENQVVLFQKNGFHSFNGSSLTNIGLPVGYLNTTTLAIYGATYLSAFKEAYFDLDTYLLCYTFDLNKWYRRAKNFSNQISSLAPNWSGQYLVIGDATRKLLVEDVTWTAQPVYDSAVGTAYATPQFDKHLYSNGNFVVVKEMVGHVYLNIRVVSVSSTYYSTATNCWFNLYYLTLPPRTASLIYPTSATFLGEAWISNHNDGSITTPRVAFRAITFRGIPEGQVAGKPAGQVIVYGIEAEVRGIESVEK